MKTEWVRCLACGELKATDFECYARRLKKYGTKSKMELEWKCKGCKNSSTGITSEKITDAERRKRLQKEVNKIRREQIPLYEI